VQLELRLKTLLEKKKMMQARAEVASKTSANFITLEEGFQQFIGDLNKLQVRIIRVATRLRNGADEVQQYVEINATAFSKILKKVSLRHAVIIHWRIGKS
jgi:CDK inhibitor PHO81